MAVFLDVRVIPRAARPGLAGTRDGALLVRVSAPPVQGAANAELIQVLAKELGVSKRQVAIRRRRARSAETGEGGRVTAERIAEMFKP